MRPTVRPLLLLALLLVSPAARAADYNPLEVAKGAPKLVDLTVRDEKRTRDLPVRVYLPAGNAPAPVVLFSHGLGGSREGPAYLGEHWSARGYVVVYVQHPGSDDSVWKDTPVAGRMAGLQQAASVQNLLLRVADVPAVLDQLERWNKADGHPLAGRLDLSKVGMSGHSFGAVTTQAVSGQTPALGRGFTDARIKAAAMMSPSPPRRGDAKQAFAAVKVPWLLLTGTADGSPIGDTKPEDRRLVYPALPPGSKYELVLDKAEHSAFGDRPLPGEKGQRNPSHHKAVLAVSTAFWDAYLKGDAAAKAWLDGDAVRGVLEKGDGWQRK
ncbi:MAG TPA: hypothetical protein VF796_09490 [Humisphaera sp.]